MTTRRQHARDLGGLVAAALTATQQQELLGTLLGVAVTQISGAGADHHCPWNGLPISKRRAQSPAERLPHAVAQLAQQGAIT
ncbi:MAG: hypothetical protein FJX76_19385 [Armatimonadetes bacterium]|nr:hypothetical protein [Armatimonadota bacterium]